MGMGDKKPNRISALLDQSPKKGAPIARELGEEDENPAEADGGEPSEEAKKEVGAKFRAALDAKDDVAIYEAICAAYRLESTDGGGASEDAEEPYGGDT